MKIGWSFRFFDSAWLRLYSIVLIAVLPLCARAQWSIPLPEVARGSYSLRDTIYMGTAGQDDWPGTADKPVRTFQKAMQLIPFGTPGLAGGHAYGLVRLLPGKYTLPEGLQQGENQWKKGNTFKNISIEGIGDVLITGNPNSTGIVHGLRLMGDHFFVRNVTITQFTGIGLFIQRPTTTPDEPGPSHVLIENVTIDSTGSHGMLIFNSDIVQVSKSRVLRGSRLHFDNQPQLSCTAWPSGLKLHFSKKITVEECEVAYTRGEGLNFHNCEYGLARRNRLHDNLTNLYNDNSARLVIASNYIYNSPGAHQYAYPCPQLLTEKRLSGTGILMGNEGSCADAAHSPSFQFCTTVQCGALLVPPYRFPTIDSVFIYNNIIHKCGDGIDFWQGNTDIIGPNCISNVFVFHNSLFEVLGDKEAQGARVKFFFPVNNVLLNSYSRMKNVVFHGNIVSYERARHPAVIPYRESFHPQVSHQLSFQHNVWSTQPDKTGSQDVVLPGIDLTAQIDDLGAFDPCVAQVLSKEVPNPSVWLTTDFFGRPRKAGFTQAGAIEKACTNNAVDQYALADFTIHPNPGDGGQVTVITHKPCTLTWYRTDGRPVLTMEVHAPAQTADVSKLAPGVYIVSDGKKARKWVAAW